MRFVKASERYRSKPHRHVETLLEKMKLTYESEYPFPPYSVDIYLSEWHLGIEIDGPLHSKKKDIERDKVLFLRDHLPVLRISSEKNFHDDKIEERILLFIEDHYETAEERKSKWLMKL